MEKTREEIIELRARTYAVMRKAQCRAVNCEVIDRLSHIEKELANLDDVMTDIIGD